MNAIDRGDFYELPNGKFIPKNANSAAYRKLQEQIAAEEVTVVDPTAEETSGITWSCVLKIIERWLRNHVWIFSSNGLWQGTPQQKADVMDKAIALRAIMDNYPAGDAAAAMTALNAALATDPAHPEIWESAV